VTGTILEAPFEEGDNIKKGDLLYKIDASTIENSIKSANIAIEKAERVYEDSLDDSQDLSIKSKVAGKVKKVYIEKGDNISIGANIADIYDDTYMELEIPFNDTDVANISTGNEAVVTVVGTGTAISGTVTHINDFTEAREGYMLVRMIKIKVKNPGALLPTSKATAIVNGIACNDVGTFSYIEEKTITSNIAGEVNAINIKEGDFLQSGKEIVSLKSKSKETATYTGDLSVKDAMLAREKLYNQLEDYTITAPISGTVVTKNVKKGDNLEGPASMKEKSELAIIYDMSGLKFDMKIDELDVKKIKIGQNAIIKADTSDKDYKGVVENISINGVTSKESGVTTYPVTVKIIDFDDKILPGMNIEASIEVKSVTNALSIPLTALNRGNIVYIKGDKESDTDKAPDGYKSIKVTTGINNDDYVEILGGLNEGDTIKGEEVKVLSEMEQMMKMRDSAINEDLQSGGNPMGEVEK
ncbi:MAG: HlyD family efflux transporter periplasmic adaptor subunit, partial [Oscillospiraceae bacterium]